MRRMAKLPWIPAEVEWLQVLEVFRGPDRVMLTLAHEAVICPELSGQRICG